MLVNLIKCIHPNKNHKYTAIYSDGRLICFGSRNSPDLLDDVSEKNRNYFISMYKYKIMANMKNPYNSINLCFYLLWSTPDIKKI